jgi:putative transposase
MRVLSRPDWAGDSTIKRSRHTPVAEGFSEGVQIIRKLKTADQLIAQGKTVADVCRDLEVAQPAYHRWRQLYGEMKGVDTKRLTQLEEEDALAAGLCEAAGPCCAVRRSMRCDGKHLNPERRRRAVTVLQEQYRASERRVCRVVGQHRSTQRQRGKIGRQH